MTQEQKNPRLEALSLMLLSILARGGLRTWKRLERKKVSGLYYHGPAHAGWQYLRKQVEVAEYPEPEDVEAAMGDVPLDYEVSVFNEDAVLVEIASIIAERIFDKDVAGLRATCAGGDIEGSIRGLQQLLQRIRNVHVGGVQVENLYGEPFDEALSIYRRTAKGEMGVPFPWPSMNEMTMGMWPGNLILTVARPGIGKCVAADTEIADSRTGEVVTADTIVRERRDVYAFGADSGAHKYTPDAWLDTGHKECLLLRTRSGRELVATPEHPMLTPDGEARLDALNGGDFVALPRCLPEPTDPVTIPDAHVLWMAALLAEGGYTSPADVGFTNDDPGIVDVVRRAVEDAGCVLHHRPSTPSIQYHVVSREDGERFNSVRHMMSEYGMGHKKAVEKTVPAVVFRLRYEAMAEFIGMLWSCDGSVESSGELSLTMASERLVRQIQHLLLRLGIHSSVSYKPVKYNGGVNDSWRLRVVGRSRRVFADSIPLYGRKADKIRSFGPGWGTGDSLDNVPVTDGVRLRINELIDSGLSVGLRLCDVGARLGWTTWLDRSKFTRRRSLSPRMLRALLDEFGDNDLAWLLDPYWDEVVAVEPVGVRPVRDFSIATTHWFVANDFVVHNTMMALLVTRHASVVGDVDVTVISPEMLKWELAERAVSIDTRIGYGKIVTGRMDDDELSRYRAAKGEGLRRGVEVLDRRDFLDKKKDRDVLESVIEDAVERSIRKGRRRLVVVDALYKLGSERDQMERMIANVYWAIQMGLTYEIPVFATSQYNRAAGKGGTEGTLEDLGCSDVGAQEAHQVFGLFRDGDLRQQRQMGVKALKVRRMAREGKLDFNVHWDFGTMVFGEVDNSHNEFVDDEFAENGKKPKNKRFDY